MNKNEILVSSSSFRICKKFLRIRISGKFRFQNFQILHNVNFLRRNRWKKVNVKLNFWVRYTLLMAGETSAASLRCVSPLASGSTVVACRPAALASSSVAQRYRSPTKISRFYLRYLAYRDILGQNLDILSGPRYLGSDPRYLPYLVISVGARGAADYFRLVNVLINLCILLSECIL